VRGQLEKSFSGRATGDSYSIGVRFAELGSGYWVVPVGAEDVFSPGELTWKLELQVSPDVDPGLHVIELVVFGADGSAGIKQTAELCVTARYDDSLSACDATVKPPAALISLSWDVNSDVDLVLITPSGKVVDARNPSTVGSAVADGGVDEEEAEEPSANDPGVGFLHGDSNADCQIDGAREEDVVWKVSPEPGRYLVYANLFNSCGNQASHFKVTASARARGKKPGTYQLVPIIEPVYGTLLGVSENGGETPGLYVTTVVFR
jgi:hypothetical protein